MDICRSNMINLLSSVEKSKQVKLQLQAPVFSICKTTCRLIIGYFLYIITIRGMPPDVSSRHLRLSAHRSGGKSRDVKKCRAKLKAS